MLNKLKFLLGYAKCIFDNKYRKQQQQISCNETNLIQL